MGFPDIGEKSEPTISATSQPSPTCQTISSPQDFASFPPRQRLCWPVILSKIENENPTWNAISQFAVPQETQADAIQRPKQKNGIEKIKKKKKQERQRQNPQKNRTHRLWYSSLLNKRTKG